MSTKVLPVAILAGGLATRLRPLTMAIPKALVDVNGKPFVAHQLKLLREKGVEKVVMCVGYRGEMVERYVKDGARFGLHVEFVFDGPQLLGTAGAIKQALPVLGPAFFVLYGDSYLPCDYRPVQTAFERSGKVALMTVFHNCERWGASNVEYRDGQIIRYDKQNRTRHMDYIDYGLGVFSESAFRQIPPEVSHDLSTLYQSLLRVEELAAYEVSQRFYEVGSLRGLEEIRGYLPSPYSQKEVTEP